MSSLLDLINKRKAAVSQVKTLKPNPGRNRYRILPSWRGPDQQFWMDFGQHFIKDATGQVKAVYVCADKTFSKPCAVCDAIAHGIMASTDDLTKKRLEEARSTARVLLNVLHLDGPTPGQVQILEIAPTVFNGNKGVGGIISQFTDWPDMIDLEKGADVIIEKSGTGKDTRYGVSVVPGKPVDPSVMSQLHDLDKFVQQENDSGRNRALMSVSAISGVLPAPSAASIETPNPGIFTPVKSPAAAATSFTPSDDFEDIDAQQAAALVELETRSDTAKAAAVAATSSPPFDIAPEASSDPDLDDLLKDLG